MRIPRNLSLGLVSLVCVAGVAAAADAAQRTPTPRAIHSELGEPRAAPEAPSPFGFLSPRRVDALKLGLSAAGAGLLLWGAALRRAGRPDASRRLRDAALLALGVLGALCWWNLGRFHYPHYTHRADVYHHFVGAKYFGELGYHRLYHCTAVAEAEAGRSIGGRPMRDLVDNTMRRAESAVADPATCKSHFSEARWQEFRSDVEWFHSRLPPRMWRRAQMDHGYNATPAWGAIGSTLANTGPASEARLLALTLLDPLLLAVMWLSVVWAFGWRSACVAALFWGTNPWAHFGWIGGGYLRQDWLVTSVVSLCLLRRRHPVAAGFALSCAASFRLFPILIFAGLGLKALGAMFRERRLHLAQEHWLYAAGALAGAAVVLASSLAITGRDAWPDFAANSRVHLATPLENHMGLPTALAHDPAAITESRRVHRGTDPFGSWKETRRATLEARRPLFVALVAAFVLLLTRAASRQEDWVAASLGVGLIPIAGELTCYYYGVLLAFGLLWTRRESVGVALCLASVAGWIIGSRWADRGDAYALSSLVVVALVVYVTALFAFGAPSSPPESRAGATPE